MTPADATTSPGSLPSGAAFAEQLWLCGECDAVVPARVLRPGELALCPVCRGRIARCSRYHLTIPLALAIAALLLIIPACTLPLMEMHVLSGVTHHSVVSGIRAFIARGTPVPALLIAMAVIIVPLTHLFTVIVSLIMILRRVYPGLTIRLIRVFEILHLWCMPEVYLLGIFIAIVKLDDVAQVEPDTGLVVFIAFVLCHALTAFTIQPRTLWHAFRERYAGAQLQPPPHMQPQRHRDDQG